MALDFQTKDILHKITAKFVHAYLPDAKKPYKLKAVFQPELDVHGLAGKADVYNIETDPKVIEEGLTAAFELILYLTAGGFKIKTPLFNLRTRLGGEYGGDETRLPDGTRPEVLLQTTSGFREYVREKVQVLFYGIDDSTRRWGCSSSRQAACP